MDTTKTLGDYAYGKPVMELCNHPEYLTDDSEFYGGNDEKHPGYLGTHWPSFITVDLIEKQTIGAICLKLWDWGDDEFNKDPQRRKKQEMQYAYRLLVSSDRNFWSVLYDSADCLLKEEKFRKGWQCFVFPPQQDIRFIRVHCLKNRKNSGFHIVKLKAFANAEGEFFRNLIQKVPCIECKGVVSKELGDGAPLSVRIINLAGQLQEIRTLSKNRVQFLLKSNDPKGPETEYFFLAGVLADLDRQRVGGGDVIGRLFKRGHEVQLVSASIEETRSLIVEPVRRTSEKDASASKKSFIQDYFFGLFQFAIVTIMYCIGEEKSDKISGLICVGVLIVTTGVFCWSYFRIREHIANICARCWSYFRKRQQNLSYESKKKPSIRRICDSEGNCLDQTQVSHGSQGSICNLFSPSFFGPQGPREGEIFYNENEGFHEVLMPGWVEFDFGKEEGIRYLRFLLWDNAGEGKKQRSHRAYNYRVLFRPENTSTWTVLHDTMGQGSCGWQEFVKEDGNPWPIRFIRIYGISNTGTVGKDTLRIVRLGVSQELDDLDLQHVIRTRILKYDDVKGKEFGIPDIMKGVYWLRQRGTKAKDETDREEADAKLVTSDRTKSASPEKIPNQSMRNLFKSISKFVEKIVNEDYSIDFADNFAKDIQSLVGETLKPVHAAKQEQEKFENDMRLPKTILVLAAIGPIAFDCLKKTKGIMLSVLVGATLVFGFALIYAIWKDGDKRNKHQSVK